MGKVKTPRKQSLSWMTSRLTRLRYVKSPSDRQKARIQELEKLIRYSRIANGH